MLPPRPPRRRRSQRNPPPDKALVTGRPAQLRPDSSPPAGGLPPHDVAAEEAVIAALLLDATESYPRVLPLLQPRDFFREQNGWCYDACLALADRGEAITIPTLAHELERAGRLDAMGGEPYLAELVGRHFSAVGVEAHARIVARDALYRRLIQAAGQIAQTAYEGGPDAGRVISAAEALLLGIRSTEAAGELPAAARPPRPVPRGPRRGGRGAAGQRRALGLHGPRRAARRLQARRPRDPGVAHRRREVRAAAQLRAQRRRRPARHRRLLRARDVGGAARDAAALPPRPTSTRRGCASGCTQSRKRRGS